MRQILPQATVAACLVGAGPCAAHHDDVPDPPPDLDQVVPAAVAESLTDLYWLLGVDVHSEPVRPANHGMPVETYAGESRFPPRDCTEHALPFVIECGYDGAELLLRHLYPDGFSDGPVDPHDAGSLQPFDQTGRRDRFEQRRLCLRARRVPIRGMPASRRLSWLSSECRRDP
jgi:hypothetical protein